MNLEDNQSALLLEIDEDGEVTVNVASAEIDGITGKICMAIATLLMEDADFQNTVMKKVEELQGGNSIV